MIWYTWLLYIGMNGSHNDAGKNHKEMVVTSTIISAISMSIDYMCNSHATWELVCTMWNDRWSDFIVNKLNWYEADITSIITG